MYRLSVTKDSAIWNWINNIIGVTHTVIWDKQNISDATAAIKPSEPFSTINIKSPKHIGRAEVRSLGNGQFIYGFIKTYILEINIFGGDVIPIANTLVNYQHIMDGQASLIAEDIAIQRLVSMSDLTVEISGRYKQRACVEFLIRVVESLVLTYDELKTIILTNGMNGEIYVLGEPIEGNMDFSIPKNSQYLEFVC